MIRIVAGGKPSKNWVLEGQNEYLKRLKPPYNAEISYLAEVKIADLARNWPYSARDYVILLDERGEISSSVAASERLERAFTAGRRVVLLIGGAYGVPDEMRQRADYLWSFSKQVFPHELMRVMVAEQLYRAQEIARGGKYHHM